VAYIITETCVDLKDKSCVDVCPVDCIIDGGAEDRLLLINPCLLYTSDAADE